MTRSRMQSKNAAIRILALSAISGLGLVPIVACGETPVSTTGTVTPAAAGPAEGFVQVDQSLCEQFASLEDLDYSQPDMIAECAGTIVSRGFHHGPESALSQMVGFASADELNEVAAASDLSPIAYGALDTELVRVSLLRADQPVFSPKHGPLPPDPAEDSRGGVDSLLFLYPDGEDPKGAASMLLSSRSQLYEELVRLLTS